MADNDVAAFACGVVVAFSSFACICACVFQARRFRKIRKARQERHEDLQLSPRSLALAARFAARLSDFNQNDYPPVQSLRNFANFGSAGEARVPDAGQASRRNSSVDDEDLQSTCTGISSLSHPSQPDIADLFSLTASSQPLSVSPAHSSPSVASLPEVGSQDFYQNDTRLELNAQSDTSLQFQEQVNQSSLQHPCYAAKPECFSSDSPRSDNCTASARSLGVMIRYAELNSWNSSRERVRNHNPPKIPFKAPLKLPWSQQYDTVSVLQDALMEQPADEPNKTTSYTSVRAVALPLLNLESLRQSSDVLDSSCRSNSLPSLSDVSASAPMTANDSTNYAAVSLSDKRRSLHELDDDLENALYDDHGQDTFRARNLVEENNGMELEALPPGMVPTCLTAPMCRQPSFTLNLDPKVVLGGSRPVVPLSALPNLARTFANISRHPPRPRTREVFNFKSQNVAVEDEHAQASEDQACEVLSTAHFVASEAT